MPRLRQVEPEDADEDLQQIFTDIKKQLGTVPNIFKGMAAGPTLLKAYLQLDEIIADGELSDAQQDIVRLVVSQYNGCDYCLAAHTKTGSMHGLSTEETLDIRRGTPKDEQTAALITFTRRILETRGAVADNDLQAFYDAGFTDAQVNDVITIVGQKTLSNYFNHIHQTELDFPAAPGL